MWLQVYRLPMESLGRFGALLEVLESSQPELGIGHMGLSMPTLVSIYLNYNQHSQEILPAGCKRSSPCGAHAYFPL